jgi:hypothetical protein
LQLFLHLPDTLTAESYDAFLWVTGGGFAASYRLETEFSTIASLNFLDYSAIPSPSNLPCLFAREVCALKERGMPIAIRRIANFSNREALGAKLGEQFGFIGADDELLFNPSVEIRCGAE